MQSDFLTLDNPHFDLDSLKRRRQSAQPTQTPTNLLSIPLRDALVIQPPLAPNERLPRSFIIPDDEPALSKNHLPSYHYAAGLELYIHPRHIPMYQLALSELYDTTYRTTHGTATTQRLGCNGPLCRRVRNLSRFQAARLRKARTGKADQARYTHLQSLKDRYDGLKRSQPIYAAVEPLLEAMTAWSHLIRPPESPNQLSTVYIRLTMPYNRDVLHRHLKLTYGDTVSI